MTHEAFLKNTTALTTGYLITAMNGTKPDSATNTYWTVFDQKTGELIPCGVSSYVPADNSITIFRYTYVSVNFSATGYCTKSSG